MIRAFLLPLLLMLVTLAHDIYAQQKSGDFELQFYGTYFRTVGTDIVVGSGRIGGKIGPYLTNHLQVGIGPSLTITTVTAPSYTYDPNSFDIIKTEETKTTTEFGSTVFIVYSLLSSGGKFVPYVGAQWFKSNFNQPLSEDAGAVGVNLGIKYFLARKTALDLSGNYLLDLNPDAEGAVVLFAFGLSFLL